MMGFVETIIEHVSRAMIFYNSFAQQSYIGFDGRTVLALLKIYNFTFTQINRRDLSGLCLVYTDPSLAVAVSVQNQNTGEPVLFLS